MAGLTGSRARRAGRSLLALSLAVLCVTGRAWAGGQMLRFDIAPGPLEVAISRFAAATGTQVLYDPRIVRGEWSRGVVGLLTRSQALDRILASSDVTYRAVGGAIALFHEPVSQPNAAPKTATAGHSSGAAAMKTVTISGKPWSSGAGNATDLTLSSMKIPGPALLAPVASQAIPRSLLSDLQVERVEDVLGEISAVELAPDGQSTYGFAIRGFPTYQYYLDGVRVSPDLHDDGFRDLANIERIDVVKGPASFLYGRTEPGGLINFVSKRPPRRPTESVQQQAGSFGLLRTQLDAGGPLSSSDELLYRVDAAYEKGGSFREYLHNSRVFVAPVLSWRASSDTETTAYLEFLRSSDPIDSGLPVVGTSMPPVPVGRRVEDGGEVETQDLRLGFQGGHAFGKAWRMRYHLDGRWLKTPQAAQLVLADDGLDPGACTPSSCPVDLVLFSKPHSDGRTYYASLELSGSSVLWRLRQTPLLAAELFDDASHSEIDFSDAAFTTDLFRPRHEPVPVALLADPQEIDSTTTAEKWGGLYFQDQIALSRAFMLLIGARYDVTREALTLGSADPVSGFSAERRWDHAFKRHAAILWHPVQPLSVYASYAENFGISVGIYGNAPAGSGTLIPPESAHEWEIGSKLELLEGRLGGSLAWFDLTQAHISVPVFDPLQSALGFRAVTGAVRNRGLELDLSGRLTSHLRVLASYAYLESRIVKDIGPDFPENNGVVTLPTNTGNRFFGVPRHGGSFWVAYDPGIARNGLKVGIGVVARSWREGDNANDYQLPGFARWQALAGYSWVLRGMRIGVQLNVDNVLNARYYESVQGTYTVMPGSPRRWLASLRIDY